MNTETLTIVLNIAIASGALAMLLQLVDVITGHQVRRAARAAGSRDRDRILTWTISVCTIALVVLIICVDLIMRVLIDGGELLLGLLLLVAATTAGAVTALLAARALRKPQTGYRIMRDELKALAGSRISKGRLVDYRNLLAAIDSRQSNLRRRVVAGRWVRVLPPLIALVALVAAMILTSEGELSIWVVALCVIAVAVSVWFSVWTARSSLARNVAIYAVHQKNRAELLIVLEDLERKVPKKVAGLSERVSRALAILREQQGQESRNK